MSYDIIVVRRDFADKCKKENMDIGEVLEQNPESIPDLGEERKKVIKDFLIHQDEYEIEREDSNSITLKHKTDESVQVDLYDKWAFFKASQNKAWTILNTTALVTIETDNLIRFDFQDGHWG